MFPFFLHKHLILKKYFRATIEVCSKIHIRLRRGYTLRPILYNSGMCRQIVLNLPNIKHRKIRPEVLKSLRVEERKNWKEFWNRRSAGTQIHLNTLRYKEKHKYLEYLTFCCMGNWFSANRQRVFYLFSL
jgi:hypothetical protein